MYKLTDINDKVDFFYKAIYTALSFVPCVSIDISTRSKPWITPKIVHLINCRWNAYRCTNWPVYKHLSAKVKREIAKAKQIWVLHSGGTTKGFWKVVREFREKRSVSLNSLTSNMNNTDIVNLVDSINDDFCSVFGVEENFECKVPFNDWCPNISVHFVYNCLCNLNGNKATGSDGVPTRLFKAAAPILAEPLHHIIMESILTSTVPIFWKIADIAPIPKTFHLLALTIYVLFLCLRFQRKS